MDTRVCVQTLFGHISMSPPFQNERAVVRMCHAPVARRDMLFVLWHINMTRMPPVGERLINDASLGWPKCRFKPYISCRESVGSYSIDATSVN